MRGGLQVTAERITLTAAGYRSAMIRLFKHYVPRSMLVLALVEAVIGVIAIHAGKSLRVLSYDMEQPGLQDTLPTGLVFVLIMVGTMTALGLYERHFWNGKADMFLRVTVSFLLGFFVMTLIYYIFPGLYLGRGEFGLGCAIALAGVLLARYVFLHLSDHDLLKRQVLVLGTGWMAAQIEPMLAERLHDIRIVGYVRLPAGADAVPPERIVAVPTTLCELAETLRIDELLLAPDDPQSPLPVSDILECKFSGVLVISFLTFFERETGKIRLDALQPNSMMFTNGYQQTMLKTVSKRAFDITAALLLLLVTWPVMVITAVAIRLESGSPILYLQERVGKNGQTFKVFKFRSMRTDAEKDGVARWAQTNDSRITRVGYFIRGSRIDELPQLFNVLQGAMSFVGPRPERPPFVAELDKAIPFYSIRHRVKPGITGWAQICYPYGASTDDAREKLQYDLYYIKNYSLFLDLMVLLQTVYTILWGKGAR